MKCFIIDDDEIFVFLTTRIINSFDADSEVSEFGDGDIAISHLRKMVDNQEQLPDIILLDLNMPYMDGWAFLEEYKQLFPKFKKKISLYILSSSISPQDAQKAKNNPLVADFIIKPLVRERFMQIVQNGIVTG